MLNLCLASTSSLTASLRAGLLLINIGVDGQAHSWALFINLTVNGQQQLDLLLWSSSLWTGGQHQLDFLLLISLLTASVCWTFYIDIIVNGQAHSWAFYIGIDNDGQASALGFYY